MVRPELTIQVSSEPSRSGPGSGSLRHRDGHSRSPPPRDQATRSYTPVVELQRPLNNSRVRASPPPPPRNAYSTSPRVGGGNHGFGRSISPPVREELNASPQFGLPSIDGTSSPTLRGPGSNSRASYDYHDHGRRLSPSPSPPELLGSSFQYHSSSSGSSPPARTHHSTSPILELPAAVARVSPPTGSHQESPPVPVIDLSVGYSPPPEGNYDPEQQPIGRPMPPPKDDRYSRRSGGMNHWMPVEPRASRAQSPARQRERGHQRGSEFTGTNSDVQGSMPDVVPRFKKKGAMPPRGSRLPSMTPAAEVLLKEAWRPWWLRRRVLGPFAAVFALLVVAAEITFWQVDGKKPNTDVEIIWTFGPVLIISVLALLWWRVEYQAVNFAPWMALNQHQESLSKAKRQGASRTLLLDYFSLGYPVALYKAIANGHYLAAASMISSILLRVQIFLSTGIFQTEHNQPGQTTLTMNAGIVHTMAALFGLMALLTLGMLIVAPTRVGIAPRDPTTIAGTAVSLSNSTQLLQELHATGTAETNVVADRLRSSWAASVFRRSTGKTDGSSLYTYQIQPVESDAPIKEKKEKKSKKRESMKAPPPYTPVSLRTGALAGCIVFLVALIAVIWALYSVGVGEDLEVDEDAWFLWTCFVTLFFVALALYLSWVDFDTRRLAPYIKLVTRDCRFRESIGLAYTNELAPKTLFKSMKHKDWAVFITTSLAIFGWLMPIFTAGLFSFENKTKTTDVELRPTTYFEDSSQDAELQSDPNLVDRILIRRNPRYPQWTWQDLALPELDLHVNSDEADEATGAIVATVVTTKAELDCQTQTFTGGDGLDLGCRPLDQDVAHADGSCVDDQAYLGYVASSCSKIDTDADFVYVWGDCGRNGTVVASSCQETIYDVDTQITFSGKRLMIDDDDYTIPITDEESKNETSIDLTVSNAYTLLQDTGSSAPRSLVGLDDFFSTLLQSRLDIDLDRLGSLDRSNSVMEAIILQHGIIRAQALNDNAVRQSYSKDDQPQPIDTTMNYRACILVQKLPQTIILTVMLAISLLLTSFTLYFRIRHANRTAVPIPKNPGSIAAQASLLADSTLFSHLPFGAEWFNDEKLAHRFRKKTFRMGWFNGGEDVGRYYAIGIVQDNARTEMVELAGEPVMSETMEETA